MLKLAMGFQNRFQLFARPMRADLGVVNRDAESIRYFLIYSD